MKETINKTMTKIIGKQKDDKLVMMSTPRKFIAHVTPEVEEVKALTKTMRHK